MNKRPWHYQENSDRYTHIIRGPNDEYILGMGQRDSLQLEQTARLIVKCVNMYDDLISAVKLSLQESNNNIGHCTDEEDRKYVQSTIEVFEKVLATSK